VRGASMSCLAPVAATSSGLGKNGHPLANIAGRGYGPIAGPP